MKKFLIYGLAVLLLIIIGISVVFWKMMNAPLYKVGNVATGKNLKASLKPPEQEEGTFFWKVEEDVKLNHFAKGQGRNILIIHGGPGMPYAESWPGLDELTSAYTFHYYDQRGSGKSTRPIECFDSNNYYKNMLELESSLGLTAQIADIERIRQILGEEKLILIGHSYGGVLASLYATEFPQNVEGLILVSPAALLKMPMEVPDLFGNIKEELPKEVLSDYNDYLDRYFDYKTIFEKSEDELIALNSELGKYFSMALNNYEVAQPKNSEPGGWMVQAMYFSTGKKYDYTKEVSKVDVPTIVVHAGNDFAQDELASKMYLDIFPNAEYEVIEGAGHMSFYDKPKEFGHIISQFFWANNIK